MLRKTLTITLLAIGGFINVACTQVGLFAANVPSHFNDAKLVENIAYGEAALQKLSLYIPRSTSENTPAPVLVFFHGGRWSEGSKEQYKFVADSFTKEGYIVALADYRKYPEVKFPAFVEDVASALAWVHNNIADYNGDLSRLYLSGHSSGAHMAALVATNGEYLAAHKLERDIIAGFAGLSGPYAFEPEAADLKDMFGPPERYPLMRASNFVDGNQPPMLLLHGLDDDTVVLENAKKLSDAIHREGGDVTLKTYEDINHVETIGSLMWFWSYKAPVKADMLEFFRNG
jgi:acetyl esterase/lipase